MTISNEEDRFRSSHPKYPEAQPRGIWGDDDFDDDFDDFGDADPDNDYSSSSS